MSSDRVAGEHDALRCDTAPTTSPEHQHAAARTTARHATDASDLAILLDILGIDPEEVAL